MEVQAPKGTKDMLPQDAYKWHFVENKFREIAKFYGMREIRTPMFEHTDLFLRGVGDTTDIVQKEMYTFNDKGNRSITLKPEGTAPVVEHLLKIDCLMRHSLQSFITQYHALDMKMYKSED